MLPVVIFNTHLYMITRNCLNEFTLEPGFCTVGLMQDPMKMHVHTYDVSGKPAKRSFHLACFRDE